MYQYPFRLYLYALILFLELISLKAPSKRASGFLLASFYLNASFYKDIYRFFKGLLKKRLLFLSFKDLQDILKKDTKGSIFLGQGFEFLPKHAREINLKLKDGLTNAPSGFKGSFDIKNVEINNCQKLFTNINILKSHLLVLGTTGAGKTRLFDLLISQAILRDDCVIVFDPKGDSDLIANMHSCALFCKREQDFLRLDAEDENISCTFNPIASFDNPTEIGERISALMEGSGSASSFKNYANLAISGAVIALLFLKKSVTLRNIKNTIMTPSIFKEAIYKFLEDVVIEKDDGKINLYFENLQKILSENSEKKGNKKLYELKLLEDFYNWLLNKKYIETNSNLETLFSLAKTDEEYFKKVSNGAQPILTSLTSKTRSQILSCEDYEHTLDFAKILKANKILHISLPSLKDLNASKNLGHLLLTDLTSQASRIYTEKSLNQFNSHKNICVFIDEAGEVASQALVQLLNKSRGANFSLVLAIQSFRDLVKNGGQDQALQILDNCNSKIALRVGSFESAKIFCDNLVNTKVLKEQASLGFLGHAETLKTHDSIQKSASYEDLPLVNPHLLLKLPDLEFFASIGGGKLLKGCLPLIKR